MNDVKMPKVSFYWPTRIHVQDVYHAHHLSFIGIQGGSKSKLLYVYDTQLIIDDALLQAMPDINHTLIQCFAVMKFCLVHWLPHF